jgi:hypothetical protein
LSLEIGTQFSGDIVLPPSGQVFLNGQKVTIEEFQGDSSIS